jgi:hypothetical protein
MQLDVSLGCHIPAFPTMIGTVTLREGMIIAILKIPGGDPASR